MTRIVLAIVAVLVLVAAAIGVTNHCFDTAEAHTFRLSFAANVLSTLAGVIIGIPIALWLNQRHQEVAQRHADETQSQAQVAADRAESTRLRSAEEHVLGVLAADLERSLGTSTSWRDELENGRATFVSGFAEERWEVLKAGADLRSVRDIALLAQIADCYDKQRTFNQLVRHLVADRFYVGMEMIANNERPTPREAVRTTLVAAMRALLDDIDVALDVSCGSAKRRGAMLKA